MRRILSASTAAAAAATLLVATAPVAQAHESIDLAFAVPDPAAQLQASSNVHHITRLPEHQGTSGGRLLGDRFYLTDPRGVHVYDVSDPLDPVKLGELRVFQTNTTNVALGQEDPDTNGEILLLDGTDLANPDGIGLMIIDVSDPANMSVLATMNQTAHTWTCIADCTYAYGRDGEIVDLADPSNPVLVDNNWRTAVEIGTSQSGPGYTHDVTEVGPGRAMSAGQNSTYIDTTDPANPKRLTSILTQFHTFGYHGVEWANQGTDEIVVLGTEIAPDNATGEAGSDCQDEGSVIETYRTTNVLAAEAAVAGGSRFGNPTFELLDSWLVEGRGVGVDGQAPAHVLYCAHWFNLHPEWSNGGMFAAGYYEWGTRFVEVDNEGQMSEFGWFLPSDGYTSSAYWITRDVVYALDYTRGLDVLQLDIEAAPDPSPEGEVAAGEADFEDLPAPAPVVPAEVPTTPVTGAGSVGLAIGLMGLGSGALRRRRR